MPCHDFNALDSPTGGSPITCAQFNPGGYETVRLPQHIYRASVAMTSLNSWGSLLYLLLPPNHYYFHLPQEREAGFLCGAGFVFLDLTS